MNRLLVKVDIKTCGEHIAITIFRNGEAQKAVGRRESFEASVEKAISTLMKSNVTVEFLPEKKRGKRSRYGAPVRVASGEHHWRAFSICGRDPHTRRMHALRSVLTQIFKEQPLATP
jgi:hypothetical protein